MSCEICGRGSCTRSFHSIEDQEMFDARQDMSDDVNCLREELQDTQIELEELKNKPAFDAGLLNDNGGGDIEWWQDYIRVLLNECDEHWRE